MIITNENSGNIISTKLTAATSFWQRLLGLMFKKHLSQDEGLLFENCNSIHTFFMRFTITVIFIDKNNYVAKIATVNPWRIAHCRYASKTIEFSADKPLRLRIGDRVAFN